MATKKKKTGTARKNAAQDTPRHHAEYDKAVGEFTEALDLFHKGEIAGAREIFEGIRSSNLDEPVLTERAETYIRICDRRVQEAAADPGSPDEFYYRAVILINEGESDEAIKLLDQALQASPSSAKYLYARASASAIKGDTEKAVGDLRQAIAADPQIRFQATNDPDFEQIREEPAFIDIIEPTPAGE
jgi:tetratricopeptide (TPR) repeat protein